MRHPDICGCAMKRRGDSGTDCFQKDGTESNECYTCIHIGISESDIHGFPECSIWKCGRGIVYDSMPCSLWWGDCTGRENNDNTYVEGEV